MPGGAGLRGMGGRRACGGGGGGGRGWHPVVVTQACFVEVCTCWWLRRLLSFVAAAGAKLVRVSRSSVKMHSPVGSTCQNYDYSGHTQKGSLLSISEKN